jgi:hypothetical protein
MSLMISKGRKILGERIPLSKEKVIKEATVRNFDGGLNIIDSDLNLTTKYAKVLDNLERAPDGTLQMRYGTMLLHEFAGVGLSEIIASQYFNTFVIVVDDEGRVGAGNAAGTVYKIWDDTIAAALPGSPLGWSPCQFASFAEFKGELYIGNGIDKPILVPENLATRYVQDLGSGANAFTPVAKFVRVHNEFMIWAGDALLPSTLHISARGVAGTYVGDGAPNDAIKFDIAPFVTRGSADITGIGAYRDKLIVCCAEVVLIIKIGDYTGEDPQVHAPKVEDVIEQYGSIGHNVILALGEDMLFMDLVGVPSMSRALLTSSISPTRESQLIDPTIQNMLRNLSVKSMSERCFAVYDKRNYSSMFFVPDKDTSADTTETVCFTYKNIKALKVRAWARLRGWKFRSGCSTAEGRVVLTRVTRTYILGTGLLDEQYPADLIGFVEAFDDGTTFTDNTGLRPIATLEPDGSERTFEESGLPIAFDWQLPWADLDKRTRTKYSRYIKVDTTGTADFTIDMFIDSMLHQKPLLGETFDDGTIFTDGEFFINTNMPYDPQLTMHMVGGSRYGLGPEEFRDWFGGSRITSDERLFAWPSKFNLFKLRAHGRARGPLRFISMSLFYHDGNIRR